MKSKLPQSISGIMLTFLVATGVAYAQQQIHYTWKPVYYGSFQGK